MTVWLAGVPAESGGGSPVQPPAAPAAVPVSVPLPGPNDPNPPAVGATTGAASGPIPPLLSTELVLPKAEPAVLQRIEDQAAEQEITVQARHRAPPGDPLQAVNMKAFAITQKIDAAAIAPVAHAYQKIVPSPLRDGFRNFLVNLNEPNIFLNFLIQIKPGKAIETLGRFAINTTIGVAGFFDMAKRRPFKLPYRPNSFADSLGYYGAKPGPFLFVPLVGPTTLRDLVGTGLDRLALPISVGGPFNRPTFTIPTGVLHTLDRRAERDERQQKALNDPVNPYAASRAYYLQSRQDEIDNLRGRHKVVKTPDPAPAPSPDKVAPIAPDSIAPDSTGTAP